MAKRRRAKAKPSPITKGHPRGAPSLLRADPEHPQGLSLPLNRSNPIIPATARILHLRGTCAVSKPIMGVAIRIRRMEHLPFASSTT
jgi:hypothetical protein